MPLVPANDEPDVDAIGGADVRGVSPQKRESPGGRLGVNGRPA